MKIRMKLKGGEGIAQGLTEATAGLPPGGSGPGDQPDPYYSRLLEIDDLMSNWFDNGVLTIELDTVDRTIRVCSVGE